MQEGNKRIAKNTIILYLRTFITLLVSLYTSRIMLEALGVDNYGINAVVGGIVGMSSIITVSMSVAISRYIAYALGQNDKKRLKIMFSTAINAQAIMAIIAVIVLEIGGLLFLNTTANIPAGRMYAAQWVFQCSVLCLVISLISTPLNSLIISYERMSIYAYISIVDVVVRLLICYVLLMYNGDRLILFSSLQVLLSLGTISFYFWYCIHNFEEAKYSFRVFDRKLIKELTVFSGWNLMNNCTWVFSTQGMNLLVNVFFGVVFNASRAIATTVNSSVQGFVRNFTISFTPQITKKFAAGDVDEAILLASRGAKFTWLMTYAFLVPICLEADTLLHIWLGKVPPDTSLFVRLALFESLAALSSNQMFQLMLADGRLKKVNLQNTLLTSLIFPSVWIAYKLGAPVWVSYVICTFFFFTLNIVFLVNLKEMIGLNISLYIKRCIKPCLQVSVASFVLPLLVIRLLSPGIIRFVVITFISVIWTLFCCYSFGLDKGERDFVRNKVKTLYYNRFSKFTT